jgi:hypothetical protein
VNGTVQLSNATKRPSPEIAASSLLPSICIPPVATLASVVVPFWRSCTKMSDLPFVSPGTRFQARL